MRLRKTYTHNNQTAKALRKHQTNLQSKITKLSNYKNQKYKSKSTHQNTPTETFVISNKQIYAVSTPATNPIQTKTSC